MAFEEIDERDWRASIDSNLTATFLTLKCFLPAMKARCSGTIITMSSAAARRAHPKWVDRFECREGRRPFRWTCESQRCFVAKKASRSWSIVTLTL
jgi:NAD(P)-dependent dehydrogenase (short-subunit alcohol dehydrogenase family)